MLASIVAVMAAALAAASDGSAAQSSPPASAAPAGSVTVNSPPKPQDPLDQVVCRYMEETGTRLGGGKVCHTRREWAEATRQSRESVEQVQRNGGFTKLPGN
jgi:hypothetical protein